MSRSMRTSMFAVALVFAAAIPARAANKDMERLQIQIASLQGQVADLQRTVEDTQREVRRLNEALAEQTAALRKAMQDRKIQEEAVSTNLRELAERMSVLSEQIQTSRPAATPPTFSSPESALPGAAAPGATSPATAAPAGAPPAPRELYTQAYADYARGNFDLAIQEYQQYVRYYPDTDLSDNAQYWIGECLYSKGKFAEAVEAWNDLLRQYPSSDKLPDARFKKGMALERLGRRSQALVEYRYVADRYPNSEAGRKARERLNPQ